MKGILKKTEQGWFVIYDQILGEGIVKRNQNALPLHFEDVKVLTQYTDYSIDWDGKEIEWDRITEWDYDRTTYAKLIESKRNFVFSDDHIVDSNEMVLDDCEEVKNWDNFVEKKNKELEIEKLAKLESEVQGWGVYDDTSEQYGIKQAYINGFNKAKETLFTISDEVLFEQATVAMESHYGYGCETEIDAYFRGAKWMLKQFENK